MKFELARLTQFDDDSIIAELQRVAAIVPANVPLTRKRFDQHAKVSSSAVQHRFDNWQKALQAAGLDGRYSGRTVSSKMKSQLARPMTDEQLVAELRRVAVELKSDTLKQADFNARSEISASAIRRRFTSWTKALYLAGLKPVNHGRRHTDDDYFENLLNVWTHLGRQPKCIEMNSVPSVIASGAYQARWGKWTKALLAFIERVNRDQTETPLLPLSDHPPLVPCDCIPPDPEGLRKIPLGLRYNVLKGDHFKCVLCGNSPATDPKCKLHVDHIVPFSKNGKTAQDNLRTLCGQCNLGKSDKMEAENPNTISQ